MGGGSCIIEIKEVGYTGDTVGCLVVGPVLFLLGVARLGSCWDLV